MKASLLFKPLYVLQVEMTINNMTIRMPHQLFINGEFVDAEGGKTYKTINPTTAQVECQVLWFCSVLWFIKGPQEKA